MGFLSSIGIIIPFVLIGIFNEKIKDNIHIILTIILTFAYIIYIGGDWIHNDRFNIPLLPMLIFFASIGFAQISKHINRFKVITILIVILILTFNILSLVNFLSLKSMFHSGRKFHEDGRILKEIGLYIKENSDKNDRIAVNFAGITPYYAERYTIDMTGLNDKHIASLRRGLHKNWDVEYVLAKKPLYVIIYSKPKMDKEGIHFVWGGTKELYNHQQFQKNYHLHKEWIHSVRGDAYYLFKRLDKQ